MNNIAGLSVPAEQKIKFSNQGEKKNNNLPDLGDKKCKCVSEMCLSVFIRNIIKKKHIDLYYYYY